MGRRNGYIMCSVHNTHYSVTGTEYNVHGILYVQYIVQFTFYSLCTLYSLHSTLYNVHKTYFNVIQKSTDLYIYLLLRAETRMSSHVYVIFQEVRVLYLFNLHT